MRFQPLGAAAILALTSLVLARPQQQQPPSSTNTVPVSWSDIESGAVNAAKAAKRWIDDDHQFGGAKSGGEVYGFQGNSKLWDRSVNDDGELSEKREPKKNDKGIENVAIVGDDGEGDRDHANDPSWGKRSPVQSNCAYMRKSCDEGDDENCSLYRLHDCEAPAKRAETSESGRFCKNMEDPEVKELCERTPDLPLCVHAREVCQPTKRSTAAGAQPTVDIPELDKETCKTLKDYCEANPPDKVACTRHAKRCNNQKRLNIVSRNLGDASVAYDSETCKRLEGACAEGASGACEFHATKCKVKRGKRNEWHLSAQDCLVVKQDCESGGDADGKSCKIHREHCLPSSPEKRSTSNEGKETVCTSLREGCSNGDAPACKKFQACVSPTTKREEDKSVQKMIFAFCTSLYQKLKNDANYQFNENENKVNGAWCLDRGQKFWLSEAEKQQQKDQHVHRKRKVPCAELPPNSPEMRECSLEELNASTIDNPHIKNSVSLNMRQAYDPAAIQNSAIAQQSSVNAQQESINAAQASANAAAANGGVAAAPPAAPAATTGVAAAPVGDPAAAPDITQAPVSGGGNGGAAGGACEGAGSPCTGDVTHWDGGLGACGWNVATGSDMQIALPVGLMGSQSNGNPYCGRSLTIKNPTTGQTVGATVGDKCMGCQGYSIDLTDALFSAVASNCDGRCSGFQWWFD